MVSLILFCMVRMWCSLLRSPGVFPAIWMPPGAGRAVRYTPVADWTHTHTLFRDHTSHVIPLNIQGIWEPTARPRSIFSPMLIWMCKPNKAFMLRSFSLFISWLCSSYSMKGSRLEMTVAFTSPWAFFFRRHSLKHKHFHQLYFSVFARKLHSHNMQPLRHEFQNVWRTKMAITKNMRLLSE